MANSLDIDSVKAVFQGLAYGCHPTPLKLLVPDNEFRARIESEFANTIVGRMLRNFPHFLAMHKDVKRGAFFVRVVDDLQRVSEDVTDAFSHGFCGDVLLAQKVERRSHGTLICRWIRDTVNLNLLACLQTRFDYKPADGLIKLLRDRGWKL